MPTNEKKPKHYLMNALAEQKSRVERYYAKDRKAKFADLGLEDPYNPYTRTIDMKVHAENCKKTKMTDVEFEAFLIDSGFKKILDNPNAVLLVIDMQLDFICGALPVKGAYDSIDIINRLQERFGADRVFATADTHTKDSTTFVSNHEKDGLAIFDTFAAIDDEGKPLMDDKGEPLKRTAWPPHCKIGSQGVELAVEAANTLNREHIIGKGEAANSESYSGVKDDMNRDQKFKTGKYAGKTLVEVLAGKDVYVVGQAFDYCVVNTAVDLAKANKAKSVTVIERATNLVFDTNLEQVKAKLAASNVGLIAKNIQHKFMRSPKSKNRT